MKIRDIKELVERHPFRDFSIRLNNGAEYTFRERRDVGAPQDYNMIIFLGKSQCVRIDTNSIVEVIEQPAARE